MGRNISRLAFDRLKTYELVELTVNHFTHKAVQCNLPSACFCLQVRKVFACRIAYDHTGILSIYIILCILDMIKQTNIVIIFNTGQKCIKSRSRMLPVTVRLCSIKQSTRENVFKT